MALLVVDEALLDVEQAWTSVFYLKSFDMDSVQVGKAVFGKEIYTTLGIEPRTNSNPGRYGNPYSACWVKLDLPALHPCSIPQWSNGKVHINRKVYYSTAAKI